MVFTETVTHDPKIKTKNFRETSRKSRKSDNTIFRNKNNGNCLEENVRKRVICLAEKIT